MAREARDHTEIAMDMNEGTQVSALATLGTADKDARTAAAQEASIAAAAAAMVEAFALIDSDDMCQLAAGEMNDWLGKIKTMNERRMKITRPMDEAKREVMELFAPHIRVLEDAVRRIKGSILAWEDKKEEARRQEEARLREEQRQRELLAAQEAQRAREAAEKAAAEQRKIAEAAEAAGHLEGAEMARAQAAEIEHAGQTKAEAVMQEAAHAPAVVVAQTKVAGAAVTGTWKGELTSKLDAMRYIAGLDGETLKAIAAAGIEIRPHPEYLSLFDANQTALNAVAKAQQTDCVVPGVKTFLDRTVRGTRR
jgi:hypothetical protein